MRNPDLSGQEQSPERLEDFRVEELSPGQAWFLWEEPIDVSFQKICSSLPTIRAILHKEILDRKMRMQDVAKSGPDSLFLYRDRSGLLAGGFSPKSEASGEILHLFIRQLIYKFLPVLHPDLLTREYTMFSLLGQALGIIFF